MQKPVYAIATMDTKAEEIRYVADRIRETGLPVQIVDVGIFDPPGAPPDITRQQVLCNQQLSTTNERGQAIAEMGQALESWLVKECDDKKFSGVIGIGGSGGTALITRAMRALPIGIPKLMVSTVASGNVAPYVDVCDLTMMYSVVDVAGINSVSKIVLANAAAAIAGMAQQPPISAERKPTVGMTMFGVTTPCVTAVRSQLEQNGYDCLVFHATGTGGRAMEKLVAEGLIDGVLDITTTEVADEVVGGVFPAGNNRFDPILTAKIPFVISLGALDMVNFGAMETVPEKFAGRKFHVHNPQVTLMRTTPEENVAIGRWIAAKLNRATAPFVMVIPELGLSMLDAPGQPFHDSEANTALFSTLESEIQWNSLRKLIKSPLHINDPAFAELLVNQFNLLTNNVVHS